MRKITTIILIIFNIFFGYSQNSIEVYYTKAIKNKTTNDVRYIEGLNYKLTANNNKSIMKPFVNSLSDFGFDAIKGGGKGIYYKDTVNKQRIYETESSGELIDISMPYKTYDWKLKNEYKIISGYTCYKATALINENETSSLLTVWYTPELSFPFGPIDYDGLPGLVLESNKNGIYFIVTKIILNAKQKIDKPNKGIPITYKIFLEKINEIEEMVKERMRQK